MNLKYTLETVKKEHDSIHKEQRILVIQLALGLLEIEFNGSDSISRKLQQAASDPYEVENWLREAQEVDYGAE